MQRLFFALWPDDEVREQLDQLAARLHRKEGGRRVKRDNLHVTLIFLGSMPAASLPCVRQAAAAVRAEAFDLRLDTVGHFRRPRVVWLGSKQTPDALLGLVRQLGSRLQACAFTPEERPFAVHATLLRKVARLHSALDLEPIQWRVQRFSLVRSNTRPEGVEYEVLESWILGP